MPDLLVLFYGLNQHLKCFGYCLCDAWLLVFTIGDTDHCLKEFEAVAIHFILIVAFEVVLLDVDPRCDKLSVHNAERQLFVIDKVGTLEHLACADGADTWKARFCCDFQVDILEVNVFTSHNLLYIFNILRVFNEIRHFPILKILRSTLVNQLGSVKLPFLENIWISFFL